MRKKYLLIVSLIIFTVTGCSMGRSTARNVQYTSVPESSVMVEWRGSDDAMRPSAMATPAPAMALQEAGGWDRVYEAEDSGRPMIMQPGSHYTPPSQHINLMFIKTANISLITKNFEESVNELRHVVSIYGGFFENTNQFNNFWSRNVVRQLNATIRVPAENYEILRQSLERIGRHMSTSESSREVSSEYYDIESRIRTRKTEEARLLALIDQAENLLQIIELEQRLGEVRTNIELYESRLRRIDSLASFSTIYLDLSEVTDEEPYEDLNFFARLGNGFINSAKITLQVLQNIVIFLAYISVPTAIIGILFIVGLIILKRTKQ